MIINFRDVGSIGLIKDIPPSDLSEEPLAWSSVRNMSFRAGMAQRAQGYAVGFYSTPTQAPLGLFGAVKNDGTAYLVSGGTSKVFDYTGTTENEITGSTIPAATADTKWSGGILTGFMIVNETTKAPQYIAISNLGSATNLADLTNWPANTTCGVIRPWKYFLIAADTTEIGTRYGTKVRWSNSAVPGALPTEWAATTTNDSGSVDLSADYGNVIDMLPFGDQLAIYRERGITLARYVGGTDTVNRLVMAFNDVRVGNNVGLLGLNCVVDVAEIGHVALGPSDVYVFDGTQTISVLDKRLRNWLRSSIDTTNAKRSFLLNHASESEVWICFPETGQTACTKAIVFNYSDNSLGVRDLPNATCGVHAHVSEGGSQTYATITGTYADQTSTYANLVDVSRFRKTVLGSSDGKLYVVGNATTQAGTEMISQLEREHIALGDAQRVKYLRSVWPHLEASTGATFSISVGTAMASDEPITWETAKTYTVGTSRKVDVNRSGRYMALRIRSNGGGVWRLRKVDADVQPQGMW